MKAIIFDFDGVIHDTFDFHLARINDYIENELPKHVYKDMFDGNVHASLPEVLKGLSWEKYNSHVYYDFSTLKTEKEIKKAVLKLYEDYELYIISSNSLRSVVGYLDNNQILSIFNEVLGMETHKSKVEKFNVIFKKHDMSADDCIFVTDTLGDIKEANKIGVKTIAVDFGFHKRERLEKGNPFKIVSSFDEVVRAIEKVGNS